MHESRGRTVSPTTPPPLKNHKCIGLLSNTGPDTLENHKATKPAFNIEPFLAPKRNSINMTFRLRADDGLLLVVFGFSLLPHQLKKCCQSRVGPPLTKHSGSANVSCHIWNSMKAQTCLLLVHDSKQNTAMNFHWCQNLIFHFQLPCP